ncbi:MAG: hypothetical protein K2W81_15985 [Sphingomonas sp.]|uniref:hypothetical protein n=1 Tax=Sphingomonas sp. TaxID=28214 RepID=UPI0025E2CF5F|nr:hypothetical protein [Sphingomonas sp.]MBY0285444.1 hypothetical protein [Sphingomonas sp.]
MPDTYDLIGLGSGPGGRVAATGARQPGLRIATVECGLHGGICLKWRRFTTKGMIA